MSRRMPTRYSILTELRGVRRLAFLIVAPPLALAADGIQYLARWSWPAAAVAGGLVALVAVVAVVQLMPHLAVLQVVRGLFRSGFASVTRISGPTGYPIGKVVFTAIDTVDDDQPVTIEASWCHRHLLITVREMKEDR